MVLKKRQIFVFLTCLGCVNITTAAVLTNRTIEETTVEPAYTSNLQKNTSVCWTDDVAYNNEDIVPGAGPCEQCVCKVPSIVCSMIKCDVKTGCKIIQKANQCCPDYKCDCEYNGQTYDNGAKIDTPDTPCRVCYCKGGDVMCTTVGCYEREDCGGKIVPGTCCPKYDHCPPLDPDNPKNRIKLTTANTVTLRNGKRGSQPWLLTTDSGHTPNATFSGEELTTTVDEEQDYVTETSPISDKMITMILERFYYNDSVTWFSSTSPPPVNDSNVVKTLVGTTDYNTSTDAQNLAGASAVKEAINTIKVQSSTAALNRTTSSPTSGTVETRTEISPLSFMDENDSSSDDSSEESKETSKPMFEVVGLTGSGSDSSEEMNETNVSKVTDDVSSTAQNVDKIASTSSTPLGLTETVAVEYSTLMVPNFKTDEVTVVGNDNRNASDESFVHKKLVEDTLLTIRTTVTQSENRTLTEPEDTESAEVLFVDKGANLSYILSGGSPTNYSEDHRISSNLTSVKQVENDPTTSSSGGEYTPESTELYQVGLHKNLSLFVDASKLNSTDFLADLSTMSDVEVATVEENEDNLDTSTPPPTAQTNNDTEILNQNNSATSTTDASCTTLDVSDVEIFAKPINNITHLNETSWLESVTEIEIANSNSSSEIKDAVENREIAVSNMTEAFAFTYDQFVSEANVTNSTECASEMEGSSSTSYIEPYSTTVVNVSEQFDSTISSLYPVTTAQSIASSGLHTLLTANSSESVSGSKTTTSPEVEAIITRIQNATVTAASTQPPTSYLIVTTNSSTETNVLNDLTATTLASKVTQNRTNAYSAEFIHSSTSTPTVSDSSASSLVSPTTVTLSPSASTNNGTTAPTFATTTPIVRNTTLLAANGTLDEEDSHVQLLSQKYVLEPVKLISSVNSVYMSAGLGYREILANRTENVSTTVIPPTTSAHKNTSQAEYAKTNSPLRSNSSVSAYKILLDGKVKPLTRPPNTTIAPLSWLKRPALAKNSTSATAVKSTPIAALPAAHSTASTAPRSTTSTASVTRAKTTVAATTSKSVPTKSAAWSNATTTTTATAATTTAATTRSIANVSNAQAIGKTANSSKSAATELTAGANSTLSAGANATTHESSGSLKNESRQEPAQAKVYDPLMPYPEEYPEEYQTIQNGPAIIITRTTYTRIPDVTYTTVTMATLPTYARVQKAEENFASTLFDRKFGERSYERSDGEFGHVDGSAASQSYFNIDVKKVEEKANDEAKMAKNKRNKVIHDDDDDDDDDDQKFVIAQGEPTPKEHQDEDVHTLDEKDRKIVENFMNKNLNL